MVYKKNANPLYVYIFLFFISYLFSKLQSVKCNLNNKNQECVHSTSQFVQHVRYKLNFFINLSTYYYQIKMKVHELGTRFRK